MTSRYVATLWHRLMRGLGYARYGAHGSDWGSAVTTFMASLLAGAGGGVAVVGFLAAAWPQNLLAVPVLAAWAGLVATLAGQGGRGSVRVMLFTGIVAVLLGVGVAILISSLP